MCDSKSISIFLKPATLYRGELLEPRSVRLNPYIYFSWFRTFSLFWKSYPFFLVIPPWRLKNFFPDVSEHKIQTPVNKPKQMIQLTHICMFPDKNIFGCLCLFRHIARYEKFGRSPRFGVIRPIYHRHPTPKRDHYTAIYLTEPSGHMHEAKTTSRPETQLYNFVLVM
jgi:hypothetical protein